MESLVGVVSTVTRVSVGGEECPEGVEACFLLVVDFHAFFVGVFGEFVSVDDDAVCFVVVAV